LGAEAVATGRGANRLVAADRAAGRSVHIGWAGVSDTYFSMIAYLEQRYYNSASRYTTSAFMRLKLGEGLTERHVAPHVFETLAEALAFTRSHRNAEV
jgi:hypothetical protein